MAPQGRRTRKKRKERESLTLMNSGRTPKVWKDLTSTHTELVCVREKIQPSQGLEALKSKDTWAREALPECLSGVGGLTLQPHSLNPGPRLEGRLFELQGKGASDKREGGEPG